MHFRFLMIGFLCLSILPLTEINVGADVITQGAYAQVLCKWLFRDGVRTAGDGTNVKASALSLATLGIEPRESWQTDQPISDSDIAVIVKSVIMSARSRRISCTPERGVDLGLPHPLRWASAAGTSISSPSPSWAGRGPRLFPDQVEPSGGAPYRPLKRPRMRM